MTNKKPFYNRLKIDSQFTLEVCNEASRIMNNGAVGENHVHFSPAESEAFLVALHNLGHFTPPLWGSIDEKWKARESDFECDCGYKPQLRNDFNGLNQTIYFFDDKDNELERCPNCNEYTTKWYHELENRRRGND